jgi:hypothetical protein
MAIWVYIPFSNGPHMRDRTFQLIDANLSNLFVCVGAVDLPCGFFDSSGKVVAKS